MRLSLSDINSIVNRCICIVFRSFFFFFFSSRRRHTRFDCDWSSDVCSSDLKLRWLLAKATAAFGDRRLSELRPHEIAAWRMTIPPGHRFEATQALRQVLVDRKSVV